METLAAPRALNAIQRVMLDEVVVEEEIYKGREKAKIALTESLAGIVRKSAPNGFMTPEEFEALEVDDSDGDPFGTFLGEAQPPTLPNDGPNPFPMLDPPLG